MVVRKPGRGRRDRDWWAPIINRQLVVLMEYVPGISSGQQTMIHKVAVCESEESALRYARWFSNGDLSVPVDAVYWPRYLDELTFIDDDVLEALTDI